MPNIEAIIATMLQQQGKPYVWGHEANPADADPDAFDCSELIQWACDRHGLVPKMPDGSGNQYINSKGHGTLIGITDGIMRRGALLHRFDKGRGVWGHVAVSLGDGTTIEARGRAWGVGVFPANNRGWDAASTMPGVDYGPAPMPEPGDVGAWIAHFRHLDGNVLKESNTGRAVAELQFLLNVLNGANSEHAVKVDGVYGPMTKSAVRRFQAIYNHWIAPLTADGVYGPATHHALMVALNKRGIW